MLILASKSPRRKLLLEQAGVTFKVMAQNTDECYPEDLPVAQVPEFIAQQKAKAVLPFIQQGDVILAADTIVCVDGDILGKPKDQADAFQMIRRLVNNKHAVITGVCLWSATKIDCFSSTTTVYFNDLTDEQINYYIEEYQPYDKAGAYGIQEWIGLVGIRKIEGCYFNVVGLPVSQILQRLGSPYQVGM